MAKRRSAENLSDSEVPKEGAFMVGHGTVGTPPEAVIFYDDGTSDSHVALKLDRAQRFEEQRAASGSKG